MGLGLIIQTILICLIRGIIIKTFWFSYVLFLIFLGGILVLFIYVTSLASNEIFNFSFKTILTLIILFVVLIFFILIIDKPIIISYFINYETYSLSLIKTFLPENSIILNKLYNFPINFITLLLMVYLFLTLIAVVKITNIFEGPLRPKF